MEMESVRIETPFAAGPRGSVRVWAMADTHGVLPGGGPPPGAALWVHAGDASGLGWPGHLAALDRYARAAGVPACIVQGNHERLLPAALLRRLLGAFALLHGEERVLAGLRVYGCAWDAYDGIPAGLDILVTHAPPLGILDTIYDGRSVGSAALRAAVDEARPRVHIFGHNHDAPGTVFQNGTLFVAVPLNAGPWRSKARRAPFYFDLPLL